MSFEAVYPKVLDSEGEYSNDPSDAGAETVFGISRSNFPRWAGWAEIDKLKAAGFDMRGLKSQPQVMGPVKEFYRAYWNDLNLDYVPEALHGMLFGGAVNQGSKRVVKWLQTCLQELHQLVTVDGEIGPGTLSALQKVEIPILLDKLWKKRAQAYLVTANKPGQGKFMVGWLNRLEGGM